MKLFAKIQPSRVHLKGTAGQAITKSVSITPGKEYPFRITQVKTGKGENIEFRLKEEISEGGPTYLLTIANTKTTPGRYADTLILTTDHAMKPQLKINVFGDIRPVKKAS